jgi:hypothetical protein
MNVANILALLKEACVGKYNNDTVDLPSATVNLGETGGTTNVTGTLDARLLASSQTAPLGYTTGSGGTVTQLTSKATGVTINKVCGRITTHGAQLTAGSDVTFTVTNSRMGATDLVLLNNKSGGTSGSYLCGVGATADGSFDVVLTNISAGNLSEAVVMNFMIFNSVAL